MPVILLRPQSTTAPPVGTVPTFFGKTIVPADPPGLLSAVVAHQQTSPTDATSYTTSSITPIAGRLYLVFTVGRTGNVAHRIPTLTGTNGWNTVWTRVSAAQAIYLFTGIERAGIEVFWGVASSSVAGTITQNYGAGTNLFSGTFHVIRIDGGPSTTSPIRATASAHYDLADQSSINAILTDEPWVTSIVVACGASDLNTGTPVAGTNYTLLGSVQTPGGSGISQPEFDEDTVSKNVGMSFGANDIMAISAVEVVVPTPTLNVTSVTVTPPAAMNKGDLVLLLGIVDDALSPILSISSTGGQTWLPLGAIQYGIGVGVQRWWCQFNGTWSSLLTVAQNQPAGVMTGAMFVWRSSSQGIGWGADAQSFSFPSDSSTPFDLTILSQAVKENNEVCFAEWHGDFIGAMALQTAGWTNPDGETQWRNDPSPGGEILLSAAYKIQNAGTSGDVTNRATDAAITITQGASYLSFYEITKQSPKIVKSQARHRASRW